MSNLWLNLRKNIATNWVFQDKSGLGLYLLHLFGMLLISCFAIFKSHPNNRLILIITIPALLFQCLILYVRYELKRNKQKKRNLVFLIDSKLKKIFRRQNIKWDLSWMFSHYDDPIIRIRAIKILYEIEWLKLKSYEFLEIRKIDRLIEQYSRLV